MEEQIGECMTLINQIECSCGEDKLCILHHYVGFINEIMGAVFPLEELYEENRKHLRRYLMLAYHFCFQSNDENMMKLGRYIKEIFVSYGNCDPFDKEFVIKRIEGFVVPWNLINNEVQPEDIEWNSVYNDNREWLKSFIANFGKFASSRKCCSVDKRGIKIFNFNKDVFSIKDYIEEVYSHCIGISVYHFSKS